jgi:tetratricopeptide (TPR) repeat protein
MILLGSLIIRASDNPADKAVFITMRIHKNLENIRSQLSSSLEKNLAKYGVQVIFTSASEKTNIYIDLSAENSSLAADVWFDVWLYNPPELILTKISPFLEAHIDSLSRLIFSEANFTGDNTAAMQLMNGVILYSVGLCEDALPILDALLIQISNSTDLYERPSTIPIAFYAGNCAIVENNWSKAIEYYELSRKFDEVPIPQLTNLAWINLKTGNEERAFELMKEVVGLLGPDSFTGFDRSRYISALNKSAQLYALAEHYDDAIANLTTAIELPLDNIPDPPNLYILRGQMYLALYEWDSALADYNTAIELDPEYADAYYERGVLFYSILQTGVELRTDALADFQRYLELAPDGEKAADAARYVEQIQTELEALNG